MANQSRHVNETNHEIWIAIAAIAAAFGLFTVILWRAPFFNCTGTESGNKAIAEALTFVGALVGAIVSILGILLKYSMDKRTESRLAIESQRSAAMQRDSQARLAFDSDRSAAMQKDSENRLKLEAATKVIELFGMKDGHEAPPAQIAGGLLTLASLGQHGLAILLATDLVRRKAIDAETTCSVIDQAFKQDSDEIQIDAITLMARHPEAMVGHGGAEIPPSIENWDLRLCNHVRQWASIAMGRIILQRPLSFWRDDHPFSAYVVLAALGLGWFYEPNPEFKQDVGAILHCLLEAFPASGTLKHPKQDIDTDAIRGEVKDVQPMSAAATDVVRLLNDWRAPATATGSSQPPVP